MVDSGSTDATTDIARRFPVTLVQIPPEDFTYGYALNLGVSHAEGDLIATLSAHSLPTDADWLRSLISPFENVRVAGVYGRQVPRANATIFELAGMRMTGLLSERPKLLDKQPLFSNANGAFRRSLWCEHPFDELIGGAEDIAWARSMQERGYLIAYEPKAAVYHSHGEHPLRQLRRASRDVPVVLGNLLHLGRGTASPPRPPRSVPSVIEPS